MPVFQKCLTEHLYYAACVGDVDSLSALIANNHFPQVVRDLAFDIAAAGGHAAAAAIIKPVLH